MTLPDAGGLKWHGRNVEPAIMGNVDLPVQPPVDPMLAKAAEKVPDDPGVWSYEPKWDGFLH
ncbi:MAG: hypothetical protein QOF88_3210 [Mycobacterium sp.]|nr:hypothetical protein [Mycobacterium sp.]